LLLLLFCIRYRIQIGAGAHSASYPMTTGGFYPQGKATGSETDHSPPSIAKFKNAWSYISTPQYVFTA